jgi:hypothetical protein
MHLIDFFHRTKSMFFLLFVLVSLFGCAAQYTVTADPSELLLRSGDLLSVNVKIKSDEKGWIKDVSNTSEICITECQQYGLNFDFTIYARIKNEGNISVGPYEVKIGKETIRTKPIKLYVLPSINEKEGIFIESVADPNGSGKYQIRIDYNLPSNGGPIMMNEKKFTICTTGIGLVRHSSSRSASSKSGSANYILENTTESLFRITKNYFKGLPEGYQLPEIIIFPSKSGTASKWIWVPNIWLLGTAGDCGLKANRSAVKMDIKNLKTYEDLELFLRDWSNASGDPVTYDFNGLMSLLIAIVDNLKKNHIDADLESYACSINDEQATFLKKLLKFREMFPDDD